MRIAGFIFDSIANGEGIRDVIFVQGCSKRCKDCHNQHTWDYDGGEYMSLKDILDRIENSTNNVTISGGEPLDQYDQLKNLCQAIHKRGKTIWVYTGYTMNIEKLRRRKNLAKYVDVIVDGEFQPALYSPTLAFRGSSNQRLIDFKKSLKGGKIIEYERQD